MDAYNILYAVFQWQPAYITDITLYMHQLYTHIDTHIASNSNITYNYDITHEQLSTTGYVGLKNMGCTCYMNSLLQVR